VNLKQWSWTVLFFFLQEWSVTRQKPEIMFALLETHVSPTSVRQIKGDSVAMSAWPPHLAAPVWCLQPERKKEKVGDLKSS
jgi:hypothetical protein